MVVGIFDAPTPSEVAGRDELSSSAAADTLGDGGRGHWALPEPLAGDRPLDGSSSVFGSPG